MEYKNSEEVLNALRNGKKIAGKHGCGNYRLSQGEIGDNSNQWIPILYWYANPQMNRIFAVLKNGMRVDSTLDILDFLYGGYVDYVEEVHVIPKKMTVEEIEKELGYKIEVISK